MKKAIVLFTAVIMVLCLFSACNKQDNSDNTPTATYGKTIYVATNGNDENDGTKESPLATINGAVSALSNYKALNGLPDGGIKIEFGEGTYTLLKTVNITAELSGEEEKPIIFAAAEDAEVIFDGCIVLNNEDFHHVTDESVLAILKTDEVRKNLLCLDLSKPEYSILFEEEYDDFLQTLSVDGNIQTIARWPNGVDKHAKAQVLEYDGAYSIIAISEEQAKSWSQSPTFGWLGYGRFDWKETTLHNEVIVDTEKNAICIPNARVAYYPVLQDMPFYVFNLLCELDEPGEYYRDNENKLLYFWPSTDIESARLTVNANPQYGFSIENAEFITIDGIIFQNYCNTPIYGNTNNFSLINSTIRCCGDYGVIITGQNNTFDHNTMYNLSKGGMFLSGGDFGTLEMANVSVTNNHIYHYALVGRTSNPAVRLDGIGFYIAHNEIHDAPHNAIMGAYAQTIIEYNEIYDVVKWTSDAGAINAGGTWKEKGTIIRYNYLHDIQDTLFGGTPIAVYYDDLLALQECYCNIFVNVAGNAIRASGKNITAYYNLFINTDGIGIDGRGYSWYPTITSYPTGLWRDVVGNNYLSTLWRYATPELVTILEMKTTTELESLKGITSDMLDSPAPPSYAFIIGNVGYNSNKYVREGNNFIFNRTFYFRQNEFVKNIEDGKEKDPIIVESVYSFGTVCNNLDYTDNPDDVFIDAENGNFFLKDDSKVYRDIIGFEKWDYNLIGIQY